MKKVKIEVCACGEPWTHTGRVDTTISSDIFSGDWYKDNGRMLPKLTAVKLPRIGAYMGPADVSRCPASKIISVGW